jgi:hypothetical protein
MVKQVFDPKSGTWVAAITPAPAPKPIEPKLYTGQYL